MAVKLKLSDIPLFQFLTLEQADKISPRAKVLVKAKGESLLIYNEPVPGIFIIASGKVGVYAQNTDTLLAEIGEGGCIGEMSFVDDAKASATIRCESQQAQVVFFNRREFENLLKGDAELAAGIYNGVAFTLSQRLRMNNAKVTNELDRGIAILDNIKGGTTNDKASIMTKSLQEMVSNYGKRLDEITADVHAIQARSDTKELNPALDKVKVLKKSLTAEMEGLTEKIREMVEFIVNIKKNFQPIDYK
jgi:CRP-like cAMP-binding protein